MSYILVFVLVIIAALWKSKVKLTQSILVVCAVMCTLSFILYLSFLVFYLGFQYPESYRVERRIIDAASFVRSYEVANNTFPKKDDFSNWANRVYPNWSFEYIFYLSTGEKTESWSKKVFGYRLGAFTGDETQYFYSIGSDKYFSYENTENINIYGR